MSDMEFDTVICYSRSSFIMLNTHKLLPILVTSIMFFLVLGALHVFAAKLFDKAAKKQLTVYLDEICQWIMTTDVSAGTFKNVKDSAGSISVQGNCARVLMAGFELIKNKPNYLDEALRWCDTFVSQQQRVETSKRNEGGYWFDRSATGNIDLGHISTAAGALARGYLYAGGQRKKDYLLALERYARFVMEGCKEDPQGKGRGGSAAWIIRDGEHNGAIGCGYYKDHVSTQPSMAATAASGAFFAHLYAITKNQEYRAVAADAIRWILKVRKPIGEIPDFLDGQELGEWPLSTVTYCTEAFLAACYLLDNPNLNQLVAKEIEPTVRWLIRVQNDRGFWGEGADQQRSPGVATLLGWFYLNATADEAVAQSLEKFWQILLNPVHSQSLGVQMQALTTGLVGLTAAEMIKPGITFKKL